MLEPWNDGFCASSHMSIAFLLQYSNIPTFHWLRTFTRARIGYNTEKKEE